MRHRFIQTFVVLASLFAVIGPRPVCAGIIGAPGNLGGVATAFYQISFFPPNSSTPPVPPAPVQPPVDTRLTPSGKVSYSLLTSNGPPPIFISAFGSRDPYIQYSLSVTNDSDMDEFVYLFFGIPISPRGDDSTLQTVLHANLTGAPGADPSAKSTYDGINSSSGIQRALLSSNGGTSFDTEYGPLGGDITSPGISEFDFYQQAAGGPPVIAYDYLGLLNGFVISPGTTLELEGFIGIDSTVPEPSTLCLTLVCLAAVFARHRGWAGGLLRR